MKWRSLEESKSGTDARPLREIFAERKDLIAKYVPAETQSVHARVIAELKARKLAATILPVGAKAPEFELQDHDGKMVSSRDLLAKGRLVICFIRGRWCPFCVGQMEAMNLVLPQIERAGATLVALSPQTVKQSFFMHDQHKLRFSLLSDAGNKVGAAIWLDVSRPGAARSRLSASVRQPAVHERRRELGAAYPGNVRHRPRRHHSLRFRERGLHRAPRAGGDCSRPRAGGVNPVHLAGSISINSCFPSSR